MPTLIYGKLCRQKASRDKIAKIVIDETRIGVMKPQKLLQLDSY